MHNPAEIRAKIVRAQKMIRENRTEHENISLTFCVGGLPDAQENKADQTFVVINHLRKAMEALDEYEKMPEQDT